MPRPQVPKFPPLPISQSPSLPIQPSLFDVPEAVTTSSRIIPFPQRQITAKTNQPQKIGPAINWQNPIHLKYTTDNTQQKTTDEIYQTYRPQNLQIPGAKTHPAPLVESTAMSSISAPQTSYQPLIPKELLTQGILSEAQLESIIRAGEAHSQLLDKWVKSMLIVNLPIITPMLKLVVKENARAGY